jgi:hypothetical protein
MGQSARRARRRRAHADARAAEAAEEGLREAGGREARTQRCREGEGGRPAKPKEDPNAARYVYEFSQPDFFVYFIHIEHDDSGRGHDTLRAPLRHRADHRALRAVAGRARAHTRALGGARLPRLAGQLSGRAHLPEHGADEVDGAARRARAHDRVQLQPERGRAGARHEYRKASEQALFVFEVRSRLRASR